MHRSLLIPFLMVATPVLAAAPQQSSSRTALVNSRSEVIVAYGKISERSDMQRKMLFTTMSTSMRSDLWILNLEYFLEDHEELNARQRVVVYDLMRFLASGALSISHDDPEWRPMVQMPLKALEYHVKAALGDKLALEATAQLGPADYGSISALPPEVWGSPNRGVRSETASCECSVSSDWCCVGDCPTSPTPRCHRSGDPLGCTESTGCGFLWQYACDGICGN